MKKLYMISCAILGVMTALCLGLSIYIGFTGGNPNGAIAGRILVLAMLATVAVLTVLCVVFSSVGGRAVYKLGFYVLHCGLIVLAVGFVLTNLTSQKYAVQLHTGDAAESYRVFNFEDGRSFTLTDRMGLSGVSSDFYGDGSPKHYEATLAFYDRTGLQKKDEKVLTVNHPVRVDGYKIYLMNVDAAGDGASLLVKYNPGEYVVIIGIVTLLAGTYLMCFSGFEKRKGGGEA